MCSYKKCLTPFREFQEGSDAQDVFYFRYKVFFGKSKHMHGHLAGVEIDSQRLRSIEQLLQRSHVLPLHHPGHEDWTEAAEVETAERQVFATAEQEVEEAGQEAVADEAAAGFLLDAVQPPEGEEDVNLIAHSSSSGSQGEYSNDFVKIAAHADDGKFFMLWHDVFLCFAHEIKKEVKDIERNCSFLDLQFSGQSLVVKTYDSGISAPDLYVMLRAI